MALRFVFIKIVMCIIYVFFTGYAMSKRAGPFQMESVFFSPESIIRFVVVNADAFGVFPKNKSMAWSLYEILLYLKCAKPFYFDTT
jgi:hypothetical protein